MLLQRGVTIVDPDDNTKEPHPDAEFAKAAITHDAQQWRWRVLGRLALPFVFVGRYVGILVADLREGIANFREGLEPISKTHRDGRLVDRPWYLLMAGVGLLLAIPLHNLAGSSYFFAAALGCGAALLTMSILWIYTNGALRRRCVAVDDDEPDFSMLESVIESEIRDNEALARRIDEDAVYEEVLDAELE